MASDTFLDQKGFTLIEVMIALVVLVIGVLGAFSMQLITIKGNANAMAVSRSAQEISATLDMIESLDYTKSALDQGTGQDMATLFGTAPNFSGTVTYDVADKTSVQIKNEVFNLTHDTFALAAGKLITINSVQRVGGQNKTVSMQFLKIDR